MKTELSIIIPTLNNVKGLQYLLKYFANKEYKVIVVNNKKKNLGFAGGVNKGAKEVVTKWMLILNDDIEFIEKISNNKLQITNKTKISNIKYQNTIDKLLWFAEENKFDAVSPVLQNPGGGIENYGYNLLPIGRIELVKENNRLDPRLRGDDTIDGITAACLLIKTDVFRKLNGFDESFFAYLEDVDLFLRMNDYKFGIAYDIKVLHNHMTTTKTMGNFKARQDMVNWWRLFFKHPKKFKFNLNFIIERLRNISGYLKASL